MGAARNVLPVLVDIVRAAGHDLAGGLLRTALGGPSALRVFTPPELGIDGIPLSERLAGNWVDVAGYRSLTAFIRLEGTVNTSTTMSLVASPVAADDGWGTREQYSAPIAGRSGVGGPGVFLLANAGISVTGSGTSWTGCIARFARIEFANAGTGSTAWAYLLCLP